jgi:hypothetical protein
MYKKITFFVTPHNAHDQFLHVDPSKSNVLFNHPEFFSAQQMLIIPIQKIQFFENSERLDETFQLSWRVFFKAYLWVYVQVRDLVQISADQVQIVHIIHRQILNDAKPNFLRQFGPAGWTLKNS